MQRKNATEERFESVAVVSSGRRGRGRWVGALLILDPETVYLREAVTRLVVGLPGRSPDLRESRATARAIPRCLIGVRSAAGEARDGRQLGATSNRGTEPSGSIRVTTSTATVTECCPPPRITPLIGLTSS